MKYLFTFFAVVILVASGFGQTVSIDCGNARLQLAEAEQKARESLAEAGYKPFGVSPEGTKTFGYWFNSDTKTSCDIAFTNGKLTYAARMWETGIKDEVSALRNVVAALQAITKLQQRNACFVFSFGHSAPEASSNSVDISCNGHTVNLTAGMMETTRTYDIEESIGVYPTR